MFQRSWGTRLIIGLMGRGSNGVGSGLFPNEHHANYIYALSKPDPFNNRVESDETHPQLFGWVQVRLVHHNATILVMLAG